MSFDFYLRLIKIMEQKITSYKNEFCIKTRAQMIIIRDNLMKLFIELN